MREVRWGGGVKRPFCPSPQTCEGIQCKGSLVFCPFSFSFKLIFFSASSDTRRLGPFWVPLTPEKFPGVLLAVVHRPNFSCGFSGSFNPLKNSLIAACPLKILFNYLNQKPGRYMTSPPIFSFVWIRQSRVCKLLHLSFRGNSSFRSISTALSFF